MRLTVVFAILILVGAVLLRYSMEVRVKDAEAQLAELNVEAKELQRDISILRVEVAHLESPTRLAELSSRLINMRPLRPQQLGSPDAALRDSSTPDEKESDAAVSRFDPFAEGSGVSASSDAYALVSAVWMSDNAQ